MQSKSFSKVQSKYNSGKSPIFFSDPSRSLTNYILTFSITDFPAKINFKYLHSIFLILLFIGFACEISYGQTVIYSENFNGYAFDQRLTSAQTGGSAYYGSGNFVNSTVGGGDNSRIRGSWETTNTTIGALDPSAFLMFWTDQRYNPGLPTSASQTFFSRTQTVNPNTNYSISYRVGALTSLNIATIQTYIGSTQASSTLQTNTSGTTTTTLTTGNWTTITVNWNSGSNTQMYFGLVNSNTDVVTGGNDFALGEVTLKQFPPAQPSLSISKASNAASWAAPTTGSYTLTASNVGLAATTGTISITDTLPTGITPNWSGTLSTGGFNCTFSGQNVTCVRSTSLAVNTSATLTLPVNVTIFAARGANINYASIGGGGDPYNGGSTPAPGASCADNTHCASALTTITGSTDLSITKTDGIANVGAGNQVTYTINVTNIGTAVSGAAIADPFPAALSGINWTCTSAGGAVCPNSSGSGDINQTIATFPSGGTLTYTATGTLANTATGTLANTATISAPSGITDILTGNNSSTDTDTIIPAADLAISKTGPATLNFGSISYTVVVSNSGPASAANAVFKDPSISGLNVTGVTCGSPTNSSACPILANTTVNLMQGSGIIIPTLTSGGSVTFTVTGTTTAVGSMTNTATITAPSTINDSNSTNNSSSQTTNVVAPDLTIGKSHTGSFTRGSTGTYTLAVTNSGTAVTSGTITVTDTLPSGLRVNGGTAGAVTIGGTNSANWTCNSAAAANDSAQTVTCTSSTVIAAGSSSNFTLTVQVTAAAPTGTLTNNAAVSGGGESNTANNTASDVAAITARSNVTFNNYQCGSNANLRTLVDWSNTALPGLLYLSGPFTFTDPSSGVNVTVSSNALAIKKTSDGNIPSPFGTNYLEITNNFSPTVTINLSQAVRIQTMLADVDNTENPTIVGYNGAALVLPQVVAHSAFSPIITNQATNMKLTATGVSGLNIGDYEPAVTADIIFNSPVDKIVISNSGGIIGSSINLLNFTACAPSLNVNKVSTGGTGSFTFNTTPSNGFTAKTVTTTAVNTPVGSGYSYLTAANTATTVTENIPGGWSLASAVCVDGNNNAVTSSLAGNVLTLPAGSVKLDTAISCTFTNASNTPPNIGLVKSCSAPANCTTSSQLPGTDLTYKITFTNSGGQNAGNMTLVDAVPANTDYKLGSAAANIGTTGLTILIEYSSDYSGSTPAAATWGYTPVSAGGGASTGYDRLVKAVRWRVTAGTLSNVSPNNTGDISFVTKIR